jgi:hypothetical protein
MGWRLLETTCVNLTNLLGMFASVDRPMNRGPVLLLVKAAVSDEQDAALTDPDIQGKPVLCKSQHSV